MRKGIVYGVLVALVVLAVFAFGSRVHPDAASGLPIVEPDKIPADAISRYVHASVPVVYRAHKTWPDGSGMLAYTYQEDDITRYWVVRFRNGDLVWEGGGPLDATLALTGWVGKGYICGVVLDSRIGSVEGTTAYDEKVKAVMVNGFWFAEVTRVDDLFAAYAVQDAVGRTFATGQWSLPGTGNRIGVSR